MLNLSPRAQSLRAILSWCLYDWACSSYSSVINTFVFATYFTEKVATSRILGTAQWAHANTAAGFLIALSSPILAAMVSHYGRRKPWLVFFALVAIVASALLWFARPAAPSVMPTLLIFVIGTVAVELAFVFYNALLGDLAPPTFLGRISGLSSALGYFGGIASLVLMLLLLQGHFAWLHLNQAQYEQIRISGPLVAVWLLIFMLPLLLWVPDRSPLRLTWRQAVVQGLNSLGRLLRTISHYQSIFKFLLARMIYIDGLNTLFAFAGIYAAGTMHMNFNQVIQLGIMLNVSAGIGALAFSWLDDKRGSVYTLLLALFIMILCGSSLLLTHRLIWFWLFAIGVSLCVGPIQAASRSYLVRISPPELTTEFFGIYALSGRATAFLGPWVLGWVTWYYHSQRAGMATIIAFLIVGAWLLFWSHGRTASKNS